MIVFTYPGQGSQKMGMGNKWQDHPSWELVLEASSITGRDLSNLLLNADDDELKQTKNAQITTFITSMVIFDALQRVGVEAASHAGHSLGEYTALTASGALDFEDAVKLVTERGEAMQACAESQEGTMAAILGLDDELVESVCHRVDDDVWVANYNAPGQVVIAGSPSGIEAASEIAKEIGAKRAMRLPVSGAFHTPYMEPARDRLREAIESVEFRSPDHPVYANVDAIGHEAAGDWPALLSSQLTSPVRWRQILHQLEAAGFATFVEVGPGAVLTGMTKRTLKDTSNISVSSPESIDSLLEMISGQQPSTGDSLEGEHLFATERLVVSPCAGVFVPTNEDLIGQSIHAGFLLGLVNETEVRSAFAGEIQGFLAVDGERVTSSQPIAWLRITK
ncbi:MAG: ACP S-malonyltransferase [Acidimicrobiales bacterium]|jgi:[acyl-carrier-protein] S-malonyltransferase|nr:ACP S-malonyltransferase [Acidimicrobiales bacterium]MDP6298917.1 ACP S-malonyltransferase [Acidimicrobiales bacterium]HJM27876.1 ACP S-malonyltransferase [Acidimicrobiales bacterium]HJM98435.1 ACP S-malonyltransferase [Acidimicrobiales bacterium]